MKKNISRFLIIIFVFIFTIPNFAKIVENKILGKYNIEYEKPIRIVEYPIEKVTHVFFHILVEEPNRTFNNNKGKGKAYNSVMTTTKEFKEMLQQMYERNYILVSIHDLGEIQLDDKGKKKFVPQKLMLPEDKIPMVMSQDDVCYYEYMNGTGCATKLLIDEETGKIKNEYIDRDGNTLIGSYDLVPILDDFIEQHPDFSHNGAKAILALTGYNGILGYRTDETYDKNSPTFSKKNNKTANPNIEEDREYVKKLAKALYDDGYEFASHSWGHLDYGKISLNTLKNDNKKWQKNVQELLPTPTDILIFPFGSDIGNAQNYSNDNQKYRYLSDSGFTFFCNVDSTQHWVKAGRNFLRQGRRNLDGYRMWEAVSGGKNRLSDLFDVESVFDSERPTPVYLQ